MSPTDPRRTLALFVAAAVVLSACTAGGRVARPPSTITASEQATEPVDDLTTDVTPIGDERESKRVAMLAAFGDVGQALIDLGASRQQWVAGELDDNAWRTAAEGAELRLRDARPGVRGLKVDDERATEIYAISLEVHIAALVVDRAATLASGDLRTQAQHLGARLRLLGDRVFDAAQARLDLLPDVELTAPVPDWSGFDLVPAPPLAVATEPVQTPSSTTPVTTWPDVLSDLDLVSPAGLSSLTVDGDTNEVLRAAARLMDQDATLAAAAVAEARAPDVVLVRLSVLLRAEALRAAALANLVDTNEDLTGAVSSLLEVAVELSQDVLDNAGE